MASSPKGRLPLALLLSLVILTAVCPAAAEEPGGLAAALDAYQRGELDQALSAFDGALREGGHPAEDLVTIYLHLGVLRGATGDIEAARRAFDRALSLNPNLSPPSELGGQLRVLFDELHEARAGRGLRLQMADAEADPRADPRRLSISVEQSPPGLVAAIELTGRGRGASAETWSRELSGAGPFVVGVPLADFGDQPVLPVIASVRDEFGNVLATSEIELFAHQDGSAPEASPPQAEPGPATPTQTPTARRRRWPWYRHPAFWVAVGCVVAGGVATGVVLGTRDEANRYILGPPQVR